MSYFAIVLYRLSVSDPQKEEHIRLRISSNENLLGNVREMIVDSFGDEIGLAEDAGADNVTLHRLRRAREVYRNITDPFNIPNGETFNFTSYMDTPPEDTIFIMNEKATSFDFEYYIRVIPYTGQELELGIHAH